MRILILILLLVTAACGKSGTDAGPLAGAPSFTGPSPTPTPAAANVESAQSGSGYACALIPGADGSLWCWGVGSTFSNGSLSLPANVPTLLFRGNLQSTILWDTAVCVEAVVAQIPYGPGPNYTNLGNGTSVSTYCFGLAAAGTFGAAQIPDHYLGEPVRAWPGGADMDSSLSVGGSAVIDGFNGNLGQLKAHLPAISSGEQDATWGSCALTAGGTHTGIYTCAGFTITD